MKLYYFSATGNTLSTAKMLAGLLGEDCGIVPVAALKDQEKIIVDDDAVGFVYPIYNGDMPYIIRDTISRMEFTGKPYIFSVCTYRGFYGKVAARLNEVLSAKGQKLSLLQGVIQPGNSRLSTPEETEASLAAQPENVRAAAEMIKRRETEDYSKMEIPAPSPFSNGNANVRGMMADENCIGCGTCAEVCPMDNIELEDGHARIGDNCLTCLACFHWCPVEAIYMSKVDDISRRFKYHHPSVTLNDIVAQKKL